MKLSADTKPSTDVGPGRGGVARQTGSKGEGLKVVGDREALKDALTSVCAVVPPRSPRPQWRCVRLTARRVGKGGELVLEATDGEVGLCLWMPQVEVQEPGEVLVPADKLREIVTEENHESTLELAGTADELKVSGQDAWFRVRTYPPGELPPLPDFERVAAGKDPERRLRVMFSHPASAFSRMITRTIFAAAREESTRYAISGVLLKRDGKKLEMVATDGRRLALCRETVPGERESASASCIVPNKALLLLQRLLDRSDEPVRAAITESQAFFAVGSESGEGPRAVLVSNLVEGTFPPYEDVIPRDQDRKVRCDRQRLDRAVRRAALLTNEESRGVRMSFRGGERVLILSGRAPEVGEAEVRVELASYEGDDLEIGFNPLFITDPLKVIDDEEITIELKGPSKPGLIRNDGGDFLYVVMPVSLD